MKTPLAIFAYRRPAHLERTLAALALCKRLDECAVTIFCDGPREAGAREGVEATRRIARTWAAAHGAEVRESAENLGLARSIVGGVTEMCARHGRVIVLEDDLVVTRDFVRFMLDGLDRYADHPDVLQVAGHTFPVEVPGEKDAFFLPLVTTWGWATWARAWERFAWEPAGALERLADPAERRRFNLDDSYDYASMLEARLRGRNHSWGVLWQWALFAAEGLALRPRVSLVQNVGFDGTGTHCGDTDPYGALPPWDFPAEPHWPAAPQTDTAAFARTKEYLRQCHPPTPASKPKSMFSNLLKTARNALKPDAVFHKPTDTEADTSVYWDPAMAAALETWGEGNAWDEIQYLLVGARGRVLDIACGTGKTMAVLARFPALELHGCDLSDFLLQKGIDRGIARERLTQCDATKMPYPDGAFEHSYSIGSLEHFTEEGIRACVAEAARLTRGLSAHMVPVARSGRDDGWIKTVQSYHNVSVEWWLAKFRASFPTVHVLDSHWKDSISVGKWFVCSRP